MISLAASARCLACNWTAAGDWAEVDKQAEKHARKSRHSTATVAERAARPPPGGIGDLAPVS